MSQVCVDQKVDRERLANFLLHANKPSWLAAARAADDLAAPYGVLTLKQRLIADNALCLPVLGPDGKATEVCEKGDYASLTQAHGDVHDLLENKKVASGYQSNDSKATPAQFFLDQSKVISCTGGNEPAPPPKPSLQEQHPIVLEWRFRGAPDQLYVGQADDNFKSVDKAQLGASDDRIKAKRTKKVVGDVGVAWIPIDGDGAVLQVVPYLGVNWDRSDVTGKIPSVSADTRDVGVLLSYQHSGPTLTSVWTLRPDYLWNNQNESRIRSLSATYVPYFSPWLNAQLFDGDVIGARTVFDVRVDNGNYTSLGRATPGTLKDYLRVGSRMGLDFITFQSYAHPLELLLTETYLHGFSGSPNDIRYFKATLSLGLTPKNEFSIDLGYSTGLREDTGAREQGWTLSFGAKY